MFFSAGKGTRASRYHTFPLNHPAVLFLYIASAIVCAMLTLQPVYLLLSFIAGSIYAIYLEGPRAYVYGLRLLAVMFVLIAVINPLTNHRGATEMFTILDEPITAESLLYGVCAGLMLMSVFIWFRCYQRLITNDKFMFLFGRAAPTSAMVISMILKFVPVTAVKMNEITDAQRAQGTVVEISPDGKSRSAGLVAKVRNGVRISGILMSRCMEDSIETADSMRARGYGSGMRTVFAPYKLRTRDVITLIVLSCLLVLNVGGIIIIGGTFSFFPFLSEPPSAPISYLLYCTMLFYPLISEIAEQIARRIQRAGYKISDGGVLVFGNVKGPLSDD